MMPILMDFSDLVGIDIDDRLDREAPVLESPVVRKRGAEISRSDDDDAVVVDQAECFADLGAEFIDVVADTSGSVAPEVRQVLANLGGVDVEPLSDHLRRDRARSLFLE